MIELKKIYSKIIILSSLFILIILSILIVNKLVNNNKVLTNYILDGKIDYKVNLKDNGGISNQNLFVSQSVDNVSINFNYKYTLDNKVSYKYRYEIISYVISDVDDNSLDEKEVYRKEEKLITNNYTNSFGDSINIDEWVDVNYDYYNSIATAYDNSVNVAINSRLLIDFNLYVEYANGESEKYNSYLTLPLEKSTFSITKNENSTKGSIKDIEKNSNKLIINIVLVFISILDLILILYQISKILKYKKEHALEFKYRKIMKDYENIIVPINKVPKDSSIVPVKVLYFKSMIDIQKELHLPILCYKSEEFIVYMIINNKLAYIYFLNNSSEKI